MRLGIIGEEKIPGIILMDNGDDDDPPPPPPPDDDEGAGEGSGTGG